MKPFSFRATSTELRTADNQILVSGALRNMRKKKKKKIKAYLSEGAPTRKGRSRGRQPLPSQVKGPRK